MKKKLPAESRWHRIYIYAQYPVENSFMSDMWHNNLAKVKEMKNTERATWHKFPDPWGHSTSTLSFSRKRRMGFRSQTA